MFRLLFLMSTITVGLVESKYASSCLATNQKPGLCMPVKSCKPIYDFFISQSEGVISEQDKLKLASLYCGTFQNVSHVCCGKNEIQLNVDGFNILKNTTCGNFFDNSKTMDRNTLPLQYPWMALLKYEDKIGSFKCGGTLISDQYVLTAAHCVKGTKYLLKQVLLGSRHVYTPNDRTDVARQNPYASSVEYIDVEEVIVHEDFESIYNNIALLKLRRKVEFKDHIKPICLPIFDHLRTKEYDTFVLTGWDKTENGLSSDILLRSFLTRINRLECESRLRKYKLGHTLNDVHICADVKNYTDSCLGDTGGVLGIHDLYEGRSRFIQYGIGSLNDCGVVNIPGIYTNVAHYIQWITDNLKETYGNKANQERSCKTPALENGFCVPYNECLYANELVQNYGSYNAIPKNYLNYLAKSKCSRDNEPIRLCCKLSNNNNNGTNLEIAAIPAKPNPKLTEDLEYKRNFNSQQESSCTTPLLEKGFCVPYNECPYANDLVQTYGSYNAIPINSINSLLKSKCSRDNEPIRLCCKMTNNNMQTANPVKPDPTITEDLDYNSDFESQLNSQGLSILNAISCGRSSGDRVAGGNVTDLAEFPWMALLHYAASSNEFKCGGSLISNRYILTATHCVNQAVYTVIGVRLGEYDLSTNPDCRQTGRRIVCNPVIEYFGIEKIITHPRFNERRRTNDIALIKLDRNVDFKKHISPVCLPITKSSLEINSNIFTIAGWGSTENSDTMSSVLLKAQLSKLLPSVCQNFYSSLSIVINQKHICAGDLQTGRDTCRGDSGGPLFAFNTYSEVKRFIQYGIIASGGLACNLQQGFPGIYINVLTYLPWITHNIID